MKTKTSPLIEKLVFPVFILGTIFLLKFFTIIIGIFLVVGFVYAIVAVGLTGLQQIFRNGYHAE